MSFTPGPWSIVKHVDEFQHLVDPEHEEPSYEIRAGEESIAAIFPREVPEEKDANAALVVAAPKMYAALERVLEMVVGPVSPQRLEETLAMCLEAFTEARNG